MSFFSDIGHFIMTPLYYLVSGVLVGWHSVWGAVFGADSAAAWALSVVGLTVVIRAALIPLFVKQIKSSRNMQLIQPKVKELQKKYGHDREKLAAETMALYKETGTNPFASCLPLIIQMPIFFALFRLVDHAAKQNQGHGFLTDKLALSFANAPFFGGALKNSFTSDGGSISVKIIAAVLVVVMTATTFLTQRQLMSKNMPADAMTGQYAQQQKMLLYVLPLVFAVGGIAFPIGVILYWTTSNIWTMGQQFWVIRNNPAPNTEAFRAKERRDAEKAARHGTPEIAAAAETGGGAATAVEEPPKPAPRQQPKKQSRSQRKSGPKAGPPAGGQKPKPKEDPA
ncbi:membrane protein insertase YidC [Nocardioides mangrovicus]|uniref:Membrane protein insertase YidC n=1 Tax=Nocardioides mangrovicus TaxID=2478913 RepID=A0A3L8P117_9ACTN|nr:membrane protein insertase YidC [Nocardioides mangrovicus]RLV48088.1 membrane protein insertase YidC [Nocardioides mangrovicus]